MSVAPDPFANSAVTAVRGIARGRRLAGVLLIASCWGCATPPPPRQVAFNWKALDTELVRGVSTEADVRKALGIPVGRGAFLWPGSDDPRDVLYYEKAEVGQVGDRLVLNEDVFLVFLKEGRFDGFFWFSDARDACPVADP